MARPGSQAIAGYYPTPLHLIASFSSTFSLPELPNAYHSHVFFDPCAGTGEALTALAAAALNRDPDDVSRYCLGIELEASRARILEERLGHKAGHHGDAFHFGLEGEASVLFLNPPYDTDPETRRLEHRFLMRFTAALQPGGILLFVIPGQALAASSSYLAAHYRNIHIWRFPDPDFDAFHQLLIVASRRDQESHPEQHTLALLDQAATDCASLPPLDGPLPEPVVTGTTLYADLRLTKRALDVDQVLAHARPFSIQPRLFGTDVAATQLLGAPMPVALPARAAHIALALSSGLLNGRRLEPNEPNRFPTLLAKGTLTRNFEVIETRYDKQGQRTGEVQVQQPRLDIHVLRLDTLRFHKLALGTEPTDARAIEDFTTADLLAAYSDSLAALVREQLPAMHDPENPDHQIELPPLARKPFRRQAALIQAGLKLLALGENPQGIAEVGTGKSTVALSIVRALAPENLSHTKAELARLGFPTHRLKAVRRLLVVCPPHLLQGWTDQIAAVCPEYTVQIVQAPSDLEKEASVYILSREAAKLGPAISGTPGMRCPDCAHLLVPDSAASRALKRSLCDGHTATPGNVFAQLARELTLHLYPYLNTELRDRATATLVDHPAAHRLASDLVAPRPLPSLDLSDFEAHINALVDQHAREVDMYAPHFWLPFKLAGRLAILRQGTTESLKTNAIRLFQERYRDAHVPYNHLQGLDARLAELPELSSSTPDRLANLETILTDLLDASTWSKRSGCGAPLYCMLPNPRRFPLARYILHHKARFFDGLILDELHEYSTSGSAQQKAAHRLVELPGVPTIALTGSLMGGYASSLFANAWALCARFRKIFDRDDKAAFVARYGYRKIFIAPAGQATNSGARAFGSVTDREDDSAAPEIRQLGEAPGVLPLFILEQILPTGLIMHKEDLDEELPPCTEEPIGVEPLGDDFQGRRLLAEYNRLRSVLLDQIRRDRGTSRAGLLWGALCELPSYLDLAAEECGEFTLRYPQDAGGEVVATAEAFPASWHSPKETWLLNTVRSEIAHDRRVLLFLRHTGNEGFVRRILGLLTEELAEPIAFLDPARVPTATRERWLNEKVIRPGRRVLVVHPKAVQTGLNNLTAFSASKERARETRTRSREAR